MFRHEHCEQLIEMGAFWDENRVHHHRINSLSTEQPLLPVMKHHRAHLLFVNHALMTAGEHHHFLKMKMIDGNLAM